MTSTNEISVDVASVARSALLAMAKDHVPPSPDNYQKYYDRFSGATPKNRQAFSLATMEHLLEQLDKEPLKNRARSKIWQKAISAAVNNGDLSAVETLMLRLLVDSLQSDESGSNGARERSLNGLIYLLDSFAGSLIAMFPDHPVLRQQVEIIRDVLDNPQDVDKLIVAKRSLNHLKALEINKEITKAKAAAQSVATTLLSQAGEVGEAATMAHQTIVEHQAKLTNATTSNEVMEHVKTIVVDIGAAGQRIHAVNEKLKATKVVADERDARIAELEGLLRVIGERAKEDYLTGLLNRRGLDEEMERIFSEGWERIGVAMLDIDNFKNLNDTLGHEAGDKALQHLSQVVKECVDAKGTVARMGGEEFVIIFVGLTARETAAEMQLVQRELTKRIFMASQSERRLITFSAGVAQRIGEETPGEVIARADDAMYRAKRAGKNRVDISEENAFD